MMELNSHKSNNICVTNQTNVMGNMLYFYAK